MKKTRMLTPGPTPLPENVRLSLAKDMIHHRKPEFKKILQDVQKGLQYLFGTQEPVLILSSSGTGAMVAAVNNLFSPGETVVVVEAGKFGERWTEIARERGLKVVRLEVEWGEAVEINKLSDVLEKFKSIKGVLIQASETSTGVLHPIQEVANLCQKKGIISVVDGISAVGISPCPMDKWGIDCLLTGSQKGLMLPPGLAFISLSKKALEKVKTIKQRGFYFDLLKEHASILKCQTAYTSSINLLVGLQESLRYFRECGLKNIYKKQKALTEMVREGVKLIGLELLALKDYTWGLTAVKMPAGLDASKVLSILKEKYGYVLAGGQGPLKGKIIRIGHMGYVDYVDLAGCLYALQKSFVQAGGVSGARNFIERAMDIYFKTLEES
ncbi:aspartate aminotransferase [Desulfonauticus submarinus]|uniref:Aspartate aminotransferase n=1 Tax=Desulfonauticus submarinus TaxID=206665 RepID=A0A1H0EM40_9BACT|nr:alanine--glyoxylate aminotransferase family protein [Desulfonauticus submarinus]SDN83393.1 aspartate aminotransferase [Desulfonauticus submarinus]